MAVDHNNPQSRTEEILIATIDGNEYDKLPQSRLEELLLELKEVIEAGGGGGGTTNYNLLSNKPQINGVTLSGEMTAADLSLVLAEVGKGLSTNDYSDEEKAKVANLITAIEDILTGTDLDSFGDVEAAISAIKDGTDIDSFSDVESAISAIKDGTDLDSFGDVEVALLDKADTSDLGTAAAKDSTNSVTAGSTDLVESGAVKDAIDSAVAAAYHHAGTKTVAQLTHDLLIAANEGNVYNITDSGTTTSDFIEGIGKQIDAGDNVGICKVGNVYMFDLLSGLEDTSIFVQKSQTSGLLKNDGTVNTTIEDTVAGHTTAIAGKQDKYDTITYAQWQAMTPEQQAAKDYYISDYPSSAITAGNVSYNNSSSGMAAHNVQNAVDELKNGLTNHFVNLVTANAISVANTAKAGTTIAKAQLRHDNRFAELVINITNENAFDTGDTGVMLNIDWSKTGVSIDGFKSACGTCNTNASYPDFAKAGAISSWTLVNTGDVYMRLSESGIKAARLCFVFKLAW